MPQLRTRKEKDRARISRFKEISASGEIEKVEGSYKYTGAAPENNSTTRANAVLLKVDKQYIFKDLLKTVSISCLLLLVVIGIYFYLRYN